MFHANCLEEQRKHFWNAALPDGLIGKPDVCLCGVDVELFRNEDLTLEEAITGWIESSQVVLEQFS